MHKGTRSHCIASNLKDPTYTRGAASLLGGISKGSIVKGAWGYSVEGIDGLNTVYITCDINRETEMTASMLYPH